MNNTTYRNFTISRTANNTPDRTMDWGYAHENYDGPGDERCGLGANVDECKAQIDEYWEDREAELTARGYEP